MKITITLDCERATNSPSADLEDVVGETLAGSISETLSTRTEYDPALGRIEDIKVAMWTIRIEEPNNQEVSK